MMDPHSTPKVKLHNATITEDLTLQPKTNTVTPDMTTFSDTPDAMPKPLADDRFQTLLQMPETDPVCKFISKHLSNGKRPKYEAGPY